jgi:hypothetical protein
MHFTSKFFYRYLFNEAKDANLEPSFYAKKPYALPLETLYSYLLDVYRTQLNVYRRDFHLRVKACKFVSESKQFNRTLKYPKSNSERKTGPKKNQIQHPKEEPTILKNQPTSEENQTQK